jgi:Intracellular proteinase inhibitor
MRVELVVPATVAAGQPVTVTLRISNPGDRPMELYLQGRPIAFDLVVQRGSEVVWRRLEGAVVSAILQVRTLAPGEMLELTETWDQKDGSGQPVEPGDYTVAGSVLTDRSPIKAAAVPLRINAPGKPG